MANPNVGFKIGEQSTMDSLLRAGVDAKAVPGTFYLTSDTNRLYIGKEDQSIAPINAGIITVDRVKKQEGDPENFKYIPLEPTSDAEKDRLAGNYYYATEDNILCIFNGERWVQINSVVTNSDLATDVSDTGTGIVTVVTAVSQTPGGKNLSDTYSITGDNGLTVRAADDTITISTTTPISISATEGADSKTAVVTLASSLNAEGQDQKFNLVGGTNVDSIKVNGDNITINVQDTQTTSLVTEVSDDSTNNKVSIVTGISQTPGNPLTASYDIKGENGITVESTSKDTFSIGAEQIKVGVAAVTDGAIVTLNDSGLVNSSNNGFNIISGDNVDIKVENNNVEISTVDTKVTKVALSSADSGFSVGLEFDSGATPLSASIDPVITIGENGTSKIHFANGEAALDVYTTSEIDNLIENELKLFNSMVYRGVLASNLQPLPTTNVAVGDTYLIGYDGYVSADNEKEYPKGTLVIARSTYPDNGGEINGFIPPENIQWDYVTGSQTDTQYEMMAIPNGVQLFADKTKNAGTFTITDAAADDADESKNDIIVSSGADAGNAQTLTIKHKKYETTAGAADGNSSEEMDGGSIDIIAVDSINTTNGHITGYTTKKFKVANAILSGYSAEVENIIDSDNKEGIKIIQTIGMEPSGGSPYTKVSNISIVSENDNLKIEANTAKSGFSMNLVWDTF